MTALPEKKDLIYAAIFQLLLMEEFIHWYDALLNVAVQGSLCEGVNLHIYIDQTDYLSEIFQLMHIFCKVQLEYILLIKSLY